MYIDQTMKSWMAAERTTPSQTVTTSRELRNVASFDRQGYQWHGVRGCVFGKAASQDEAKRQCHVESSSSSDYDEAEATERCKFKKRKKGRGP